MSARAGWDALHSVVRDAATRYAGLPVYETTLMPRRQAFVIDRDGKALVIGIGLERGVPYRVPGKVERGYLLDAPTPLTVHLLDATTGRVEWARLAEVEDMAS